MTLTIMFQSLIGTVQQQCLLRFLFSLYPIFPVFQSFSPKKSVNEECNIKCERKRKPPDALFFYPETEKKAIPGRFIKSVLCGVG